MISLECSLNGLCVNVLTASLLDSRQLHVAWPLASKAMTWALLWSMPSSTQKRLEARHVVRSFGKGRGGGAIIMDTSSFLRGLDLVKAELAYAEGLSSKHGYALTDQLQPCFTGAKKLALRVLASWLSSALLGLCLAKQQLLALAMPTV